MILVWRPEAREELREAMNYIAARNMPAAERIKAAMQSSAERLTEHPFMHRPGRVPGTREAIVHPNYILVYRVTGDSVEIVNVLHARQQYP